MFLSTPPSWVATRNNHKTPCRTKCFYPRHPRGWRRNVREVFAVGNSVSIHATLVGGDVAQTDAKSVILKVSIHATLVGGDAIRHERPRRESVSIHATLVGGDRQRLEHLREATKFLSTPPSWVATVERANASVMEIIVSIHATLVGGDGYVLRFAVHAVACFYPRHPRGWRPGDDLLYMFPIYGFYPRHPRGWRLRHQHDERAVKLVSIHATLVGGDIACPARACIVNCFYPRHPRGWRPGVNVRLEHIISFYPRHPRGWRQHSENQNRAHQCFYPRHPRGWRRRAGNTCRLSCGVSIHATLVGGDER